MSLNSENKEIEGVVNRLLDNLSLTISSQTVIKGGTQLRQKIGDLRTNYKVYLFDKTFSEKLLECFTLARQSNARLSDVATVRNQLFNESPVGDISTAIVQTAIIFCLAAESRMITDIEFVSRDDVESVMRAMKIAFDTARELAANTIDSASYRTLTFLAGSLTNHLASTSRPLPRLVTFNLRATLPALTLSNRIYYTAERWEEVVNENHIVHPAFCMREIRGLSS